MTAQEYESFRNTMENITSIRASIKACEENISRCSRQKDVGDPKVIKGIIEHQDRKRKFKAELAVILNGRTYEDWKNASIKISALRSKLNQAIKRHDQHPDSKYAINSLLIMQNNFERHKINL